LTIVASDRAESPLILALDVGTSSVRAMLFDRLGRAVEGTEAWQDYAIHTASAGASEVDPDVLLERIWHCLDQVLDRVGALSGEIAGVGACTFVTNVLGVNANGRAVTPLTTYADTRATEVVPSLREAFDEETVHQRTGCLFHASYLPARFLWLARHQPGFEDVDRWISIGEYMALALFAETAVTYSVASWTGLLDRWGLVWDRPLLAALPIGEAQLSPLTDADVPQRGLREPFAERWPPLADVPWFPVLGDGATANVGSGCTSPGRVALTMGTTSAVRIVTEEAVDRVPDGLWCYRVDRHRALPGGALSEGGNVFAWVRKTLNLARLADLDSHLAAMEPDGHGLTVLPFLTGERSPGWAGDARATLHGLSLGTMPLDILQAGMEAVVYRIALVFDRLRPLLPADYQVIASGGALLSSPVWLQIVADVLGRPVAISEVEEASARGAALLALEALGALGDVSDAPSFIGDPVIPDAGRHDRYRKAMDRQQALYETLLVDPEGGGR